MDSITDPSSSKPSRHPPSPWSYIVRGDPDGSPSSPPHPPPPTAAAVVVAAPIPIPPPPEAAADAVSPLDSVSDGPDKGSSAAAAASPAKKAAWKRPADGSIEVGPVMGAESWPALSDSTKAASKPSPSASSSSSSDFLKSSDGSASASPGPMITASSPKVNSNNPNPNSNPQREKSMRRGALANGGPSQPLIINPDKQPSPDPSPKDQPNIHRSNWEHGTRGGDHGRGYGGAHRRGNNGSGSSSGGGGGSHHGGYNGRRDHGRGAGGGFDGYYRNANVRDTHVAQQPRSIRPPPPPPPPPFVRAPLHVAPPPPFISPPSLARPFGHPMAFPDMHSPLYYVPVPPPPEAIGGFPFVAHPAASPTFIFPPMDPQKAKLLTQINYYFSSENLCKDIYLRQNMDEQGWIPLSLIASFNKVREITNNLEFIIETVQLSTVVELQGDKIRRRNDWMNWVLPHPNNIIPVSGLSSPATPNVDALSAHFQSVGLDAMNIQSSMIITTCADPILNRSASGNNLNTWRQMRDIHRNRVSHAFPGRTDSSEQNSARSLARSDTL